MSHVALYRKYRSQTFDQLIGQEHVVRTLQNAINSGKIHHAFLFTGPRGTGKTSAARLLAKALNCEKGPTGSPCGECSICTSIADGSCMDVIEMDAASEAKVDDVRENIVSVVEYKPVICRYKVFIIDEVHDLSDKAFDALLKTVEEPPEHIVFILATTELHKVPSTIQSRCQKFSFNRGSLHDLQQRLNAVLSNEGRESEPEAISALARMADGGYRDALSLLEQVMMTTEGTITTEAVYEQLGLIKDEVLDDLILAVKEGKSAETLKIVDEIYRTGRDARAILEGVLQRLSDLTRAAYGVDVGAGSDHGVEAGMQASAAAVGAATILRMREMASSSLIELRDVSRPKLVLESKLLSFSLAPRAAVRRVKEERPKPQVEAPRPQPKPEAAAPSVEEPKEEAPIPQVKANEAPAQTGDPYLDEAIKDWYEIVADLAGKSKIAAAKLSRTKVKSANPDAVQVVFERRFELDAFLESKKLAAAVTQSWNSLNGRENCKIEFIHLNGKKEGPMPSNEAAVELPAEGTRLLEIVEEEFDGF